MEKNPKQRVAFCLRGAVSLRNGAYNTNFVSTNSHYVSREGVYNSIKRHIFDANPTYDFDVFIHCWSTDLEDELRTLYKPVAAVFESNQNYMDAILQKCSDTSQIRTISQALTIQKVLDIQDSYSKSTGIHYDLIVLYRPDVLLWKDMNLNVYRHDAITVGGHSNCSGDFHWVMTPFYARLFRGLYDAFSRSRPAIVHEYIKSYVVDTLCVPYVSDGITPPDHQEVLRKVNEYPLRRGTLSYEQIEAYGIPRSEVITYHE